MQVAAARWVFEKNYASRAANQATLRPFLPSSPDYEAAVGSHDASTLTKNWSAIFVEAQDSHCNHDIDGARLERDGLG